jgi:hypothetical protein
MEFKENLNTYLAATPAAPFKTLQEIVDSGLYHPSLDPQLRGALASGTDAPGYAERIAGRGVFKQALVTAMDDNNLDGLIYPTIRQKPVFVPTTSQPGSNCRVSAQSGLPAISVPAGFTPDGIPVGMEFLGHEFSEGDLLSMAYSWQEATHHHQPPASTPELEPRWTFRVSDDVATFSINPATRQLRFSAPGLETFTYIDPGMTRSKQWISGDLKDSRWRIQYIVPANTAKFRTAAILVQSLRPGGGTYTLFGTPVTQ